MRHPDIRQIPLELYIPSCPIRHPCSWCISIKTFVHNLRETLQQAATPGRPCGTGPTRGLECGGSCRALPDREGVWYLEAVVLLAPDALARARHGPTIAPHGHRLQSPSL